ncbi:MAG: DegV family protein [Ruminococcus sp.]|nr:DegV family protein [Ruminococcus sp.]
MNTKFILSCESTVDLPFSYVSGRNIPVIFYTYTVDGKEYIDDMLRDPEALPNFYQLLDDGKLPSTSQLNEFAYEEFFEEQLKQGDLLHIAFGSGMTKSVTNAESAASKMREKYPNRKLIVVDSLCSSSGYGMLVDYAADMRDRGCSIEETEKWLIDNRNKIHHQFFSTELKHYRRSGRMSGATAMIATILGICPIMRLDDKGRIIAYGKVRGKTNAIKTTLDAMESHAQGGKNYSEKCWICHSRCLEDAENLKKELKQRFPNIKGDIRICDVGTIIASHCGPGTVAVFFLGDERLPE